VASIGLSWVRGRNKNERPGRVVSRDLGTRSFCIEGADGRSQDGEVRVPLSVQKLGCRSGVASSKPSKGAIKKGSVLPSVKNLLHACEATEVESSAVILVGRLVWRESLLVVIGSGPVRHQLSVHGESAAERFRRTKERERREAGGLYTGDYCSKSPERPGRILPFPSLELIFSVGGRFYAV